MRSYTDRYEELWIVLNEMGSLVEKIGDWHARDRERLLRVLRPLVQDWLHELHAIDTRLGLDVDLTHLSHSLGPWLEATEGDMG